MNRYVESVYNNSIPDNRGYIYVVTDSVYLPVFRATLSITKRKQTRLNLIEEMVLKIAACGVADLDEIAGVLGLTRDILDVTLGDLFIKNLAYPSSNKCNLMKEGHAILKDLEASKKETDTIRNIYVNAVTKDVIKEHTDHFADKNLNDDHKLHETFDGNNLEFYRSKLSIIKEIFDKEAEIYTSDNQIPDELISIDKIDELSVCFLEIPIHIFISEVGTDLDLISCDRKLSTIVEKIKNYILDQIKKHRLLRNIFTIHSQREFPIPNGCFKEPDVLKTLIKKCLTDNNNKDKHHELIAPEIFSDRVLIDNEIKALFELCLKEYHGLNLSVYISNLDYWSKNAPFITLLAMIPATTKFILYFDNATNLKRAKERLIRALPILKHIEQQANNDWRRIVFEGKLQIISCSKVFKGTDASTKIIKSTDYLQMLYSR